MRLGIMYACTAAMAVALVAPTEFARADDTATTRATAFLVNEQIADACGPRGGTFLEQGVIEHDLDGDGLLDLILDHHELVCDELSRGSGHCEHNACQVLVYVRRDGLLELRQAYLSIGVSLTQHAVPILGLMDPEERQFSVRWDGEEFRVIETEKPAEEAEPPATGDGSVS